MPVTKSAPELSSAAFFLAVDFFADEEDLVEAAFFVEVFLVEDFVDDDLLLDDFFVEDFDEELFLVPVLEVEDFFVEVFFVEVFLVSSSSEEPLLVKRPVNMLPTSTLSNNTPTKSPTASFLSSFSVC